MSKFAFNPIGKPFDLVNPAPDLSAYFKLNQTTPQSIINGQPLFKAGLKAGSTDQLSIDASGNFLTTGTFGAGAITSSTLTDTYLPVIGTAGLLQNSAGTGLVKATAGVVSYDTSAYITRTGLSATTPIVYDNATGIFSWTNSNNYITLASLSGTSPISYNNGTGAISFLFNTNNTWTGTNKINTNSTTAFFVEQDGVKDNTFIVNTTNAAVGINIVPVVSPAIYSLAVAGQTIYSYLTGTENTMLQVSNGIGGVGAGGGVPSLGTAYGFKATIYQNQAAGSTGKGVYGAQFQVTNYHPFSGFVMAETNRAYGLDNTAASYGEHITTGWVEENIGLQNTASRYGTWQGGATASGSINNYGGKFKINDFLTKRNAGTLTQTNYGNYIDVAVSGTHDTVYGAGTVNNTSYGLYITMSDGSTHTGTLNKSGYGIYLGSVPVAVGTGVRWGFLDVSGTNWKQYDNAKHYLGTGASETGIGDASFSYNATNLVINPQEVGTGLVQIYATPAANSTVVDLLDIKRITSDAGHGADNIGGGLTWTLEDTTGNIEEAANIDAQFTTAAHATQVSRLSFGILGTNQIALLDGMLTPTTDSDIDLGDSTHAFKNAYIDAYFAGSTAGVDMASGTPTGVVISKGIVTAATSVTPVADGTYTVGARLTPVTGIDGTITVSGGIITAIQPAT